MNLIIVESPTKSRTLARFLGKDYQIESTMGHIRDLAKSKLSVEIEKKFKPIWAVVEGKEKTIDQIKKAARKAKTIILATDPDREGEAIAWHTVQILRGLQGLVHHPASRIVFHEITADAVKKALENPRSIDMNLVEAQKARRILDRLVGYKLSPLLWRKVRRGLSAGRVQSVAVRLIVEREREIKGFVREKYWRILASLAKHKYDPFIAELVAKSGENYLTKKTIDLFSGKYVVSKTTIKTQKQADAIIKDLTASFIVEKIDKKEAFRYPAPPFVTSTLQQSAGQSFGWSGRMTMRISQALYEKGLITYHRTDSTHLAISAVRKIRHFIKENFPKGYLPEKARIYKTKSKVAQEAHEAIRPTDIKRKARSVKRKTDEERLYDLIWKRTVACQMNPARLEKTNLEISCGDYLFKSNGQRMLFDGFLKVYDLQIAENILPSLQKGDKLKLVSLGSLENKTNPPARYTEATLIKTLEKEGIGRPSTYAPIITLIQRRQYVEKKEGKFHSTHLGEAVNDFLVKNFSNIVEIPFTAQMEDSLDEIARGEKEWVGVIAGFYSPFEKKLAKVAEKAKRVKIEVEKTGKKCPECGADLIIRIGKFGKFVACSKFPDCQYTEPYIEKVQGAKCPRCGGQVIIRKTKKGKRFFGCQNWPQCDWASWRKPRGE
jgi:DNA topoisomerase-1